MTAERVVVIGLGSPDRGDDAAGLLAARTLAGRLPDGVRVVEMAGRVDGLMDAWRDAELAVVVDATVSGARPGTVRRLEASRLSLPTRAPRRSTHDLDVAQVVELARALRELPRTLIVYGIEAGEWTLGDEPCDAVLRGVERAAGRILQEVTAAVR